MLGKLIILPALTISTSNFLTIAVLMIFFSSMILNFALYLMLVVMLALFTPQKKISRLRLFFYSLVFTPVIGFIAYRRSLPSYVIHLKRFYCKRCKVYFTEPLHECPLCTKDGVVSRLVTVDMESV